MQSKLAVLATFASVLTMVVAALCLLSTVVLDNLGIFSTRLSFAVIAVAAVVLVIGAAGLRATRSGQLGRP